MRILLLSAACFLFASFLVNPTQAGVQVVASKSLTVQPNGPRSGDAGSKYFKSLHPLGSGDFKKIETGKTESFSLTVDDAAWGQIAKGGTFCLVIVPADGEVAATYFGAGETDMEKSPKLTLEVP